MEHITRGMKAAVINDCTAPFDTHLIEQGILRRYPESFARDLLRFARSGPDPLHQFSLQLGKSVDRQFQGQIAKTQKVRTPNLAGTPTLNQQWTRIDPTTPII